MSLRAGDLRESVTIQMAVESVNAFGETEITWQTVANRRAAVRGLNISEVISAQEPYTLGTHEVEFRYLDILKTTMRVVWDSRVPNRTFDILGITENGNRESQTLICKEQAI